MSGLKTGWMFWLFVLFAAGFARYVVLALLDDDRPLAVADTWKRWTRGTPGGAGVGERHDPGLGGRPSGLAL